MLIIIYFDVKKEFHFKTFTPVSFPLQQSDHFNLKDVYDDIIVDIFYIYTELKSCVKDAWFY